MDISVVVTAIATSVRLRSFVESFQRVYPDLPIYVGAQGKLKPSADDIAAKNNVHWFELPFDCGLSKARNFLVGKTQTEFILLCDDDFMFGPNFTLESALSLFEKFADLGVVGGRHITFEYGATGIVTPSDRPEFLAHELIHDRAAKVLIELPVSKLHVEHHTHAGYDVLFCDFVFNFAVLRKPLVFSRGVAWDERFKVGGEHVDFFLQLKNMGGCRVAYYSGLVAEHHRVNSDAYANLRSRNQPNQIALFEKLGIEWRIRVLKRINRLRDGTITGYPFDRFAKVLSDAPEALNAVQEALARFSPTTDDT